MNCLNKLLRFFFKKEELNDTYVGTIFYLTLFSRLQADIPPVALNKSLMQAAQDHAEWMYRWSKVETVDLNERLVNVGYNYWTASEIIDKSSLREGAIFNKWLLENKTKILNASFSEIGVGKKKDYWCFILACPRNENNMFFDKKIF